MASREHTSSATGQTYTVPTDVWSNRNKDPEAYNAWVRAQDQAYSQNQTYQDKYQDLMLSSLERQMTDSPTSYGESTRDVLSSILQYAPQLAEQSMLEQEKYEPRRAQLATSLADQFLPQQYQTALGLEQQYAPQYQQLAQQGLTVGREADLADALRLAPQLRGIQEAAEDPAITAMRKTLIGQVGDELSMGTKLTPEQMLSLQEGIRSAQFARGFGPDQSSGVREGIAKALEGMNLQTQRQQKASGLLGQVASTTADPFMSILNRPATAQTAGMGQYNAGLGQPTASGSAVNGLAGASGVASLGASMSNAANNNVLGAVNQMSNMMNQQSALSLAKQGAAKYGIYM